MGQNLSADKRPTVGQQSADSRVEGSCSSQLPDNYSTKISFIISFMTAHEENQVIFTEELANLIEEIAVENARVDTEEPKNQNVEHELLYENERITVRESLLITMAVNM